nr:NeuD/PglB/VioB family sugar acetyltransferase [Clostridium aminobutyricum]
MVIVGAGGFGREVADTIKRINNTEQRYDLLGYVDDDQELWDNKVNGLKVLGGKDWLKQFSKEHDIFAVMAIANAAVKRSLADYLNDFVQWENIVDPSALISSYAEMGVGNIIQPFVVIGPNTKIGNHCMFNLHTNMGHDAKVGNFVSAMSMCDITGGVLIKEGAYLATSVAIVPQVVIGKNAFISAGSVVLKDVEDDAQVIGYPAKRIR